MKREKPKPWCRLSFLNPHNKNSFQDSKLVEPKLLRPARDECLQHLNKGDRILDQLLVMRRKALAQK